MPDCTSDLIDAMRRRIRYAPSGGRAWRTYDRDRMRAEMGLPDDRPLLDRIDDVLDSCDASRPDVHTERPFVWL